MSEPTQKARDAVEGLPARLRYARCRNNWTQKQVEQWGYLAPGILAQFEAGTRTPSFDNIIKLCDGLRVTSDWLCLGTIRKEERSSLRLEADNEALRQKMNDTVFAAMDHRLAKVGRAFMEFLMNGPEEGIEDELWRLMHNAAQETLPVSERDDAREASK